jgi:hypothetical protein
MHLNALLWALFVASAVFRDFACCDFVIRERIYIVGGSRVEKRQLKEEKHSGAESKTSNRPARPAALSVYLIEGNEMHVPNNDPRVWRGKKRTSRVEGRVQGNKIDKSRGRGKHKHGLYIDCEHKRRRVVALPVCKILSRHGTRLFD